MKPSLKKTLLTFTVLSAGMFVSASSVHASAYSKTEAKPYVVNTDMKQYKVLNQAKDDINEAIAIHSAAARLSSERKNLLKQAEDIERYNEIKNRLEQNVECNKSSLKTHFSDGEKIWTNISAWAEDSAERLLAKASDSLKTDSDAELAALEKKAAAGDFSETGANIKTPNVSTVDSDDNLADLSAYAKVRWDIGDRVLKDLYAHPEKWGSVKQRFTMWNDQRDSYNAYLKSKYERMAAAYNTSKARLPAYPQLSDKDSGNPADYYTGKIPETKIASSYSGATPDARWCGKGNTCVRVNKGSLYTQHVAYVTALKGLSLKLGHAAPDMSAPYIPSAPLPPWRESAYIIGTEPNLDSADLRDALPEPWVRIIDNPVLFSKNGELANIAETKGGSIQFRSDAYDHETGEVKLDKNGNPMMPMPLMVNRISAYLTLKDALERQEPLKDNAKAAIKEKNENVVASLAKLGYSVKNPDSFDLTNKADYDGALKKMAEMQKDKINAAQSKIASLRQEFAGKVLPGVQATIGDENKTIDALKKDTDFLIDIDRDNAPDIDSLLKTKIADDMANATYEANMANDMNEANAVPAVGCPVL